jgi:predicted Zn-dependent peptidase
MTKRFFLSIVVAIVSAAVAPAQTPQVQPQSVAGVVKLNRAPVSNEVLKVKLPRPVERQLSNGMKLLVVESHRVPTITLRMNIPSGDLRDPANLPGVSDATAALIRLGTKTRSAKDIADAVAELGATLSFGSSQGESTIFLSSMTENFDAALALLADVLMNPTFPQDELDKWKTRQRAQLEQAKSSPGFPANDLLMKLLYDDARRYTHVTVESLSKITRESVMEHYKTYYVPSGEWAGVSGDISARDAVAKLDKVLGPWKGGPVAHVTMKFPEALSEKKVYLIPRPNSVQTLLMVANHAIDRKSPDYIECQVMNRVLGSGPSSRLFRIIREEKGYTYGIGSGFSATRYLNHFTASTSVRTEVTQPALAELLAQFADIRNRAVPADELADAKSAIVAGFVLGLESSSQVLSRWLEQRMDGLPEDYWDTYTAKVMAVGAGDVQRVAKKYVPLDNIRIIAVGDASKIGEVLKKFGPVEEVSPDSM